MHVTTGTVVNGKIVVEGDPLPEGSTVGVFVADGAEPYELSGEEAAELDRAVEEVRTGRFVDGDEHLAEMRRTA